MESDAHIDGMVLQFDGRSLGACAQTVTTSGATRPCLVAPHCLPIHFVLFPVARYSACATYWMFG